MEPGATNETRTLPNIAAAHGFLQQQPCSTARLTFQEFGLCRVGCHTTGSVCKALYTLCLSSSLRIKVESLALLVERGLCTFREKVAV